MRSCSGPSTRRALPLSACIGALAAGRVLDRSLREEDVVSRRRAGGSNHVIQHVARFLAARAVGAIILVQQLVRETHCVERAGHDRFLFEEDEFLSEQSRDAGLPQCCSEIGPYAAQNNVQATLFYAADESLE